VSPDLAFIEREGLGATKSFELWNHLLLLALSRLKGEAACSEGAISTHLHVEVYLVMTAPPWRPHELPRAADKRQFLAPVSPHLRFCVRALG
jgi:hypothetical protein